MRTKKVSTVEVKELAMAETPEHAVGTVIRVPARDHERVEKQNEVLRALQQALGEADYNVAIGEAEVALRIAKRHELRAELQKAIAVQTEGARVMAGRAGIDVDGPGRWDYDPKQMTFTRSS